MTEKQDLWRKHAITAYHRSWDCFENMIKIPEDLMRYAIILERTKPEVIIETGTHLGGSARWFSHFCDVISIDIHDQNLSHPRCSFIVGDSVSDIIVRQVMSLVNKKRCMVVLDSAHSTEHVLKELKAYASMVTSGCYCVVEDGSVSEYNPGAEVGSPQYAVHEYLKEHGEEWYIDYELQCLFDSMTCHPDGWLLRK